MLDPKLYYTESAHGSIWVSVVMPAQNGSSSSPESLQAMVFPTLRLAGEEIESGTFRPSACKTCALPLSYDPSILPTPAMFKHTELKGFHLVCPSIMCLQ